MSNRKQHPFNQMVAEGNITDHSFIHKFGAVPALSNGDTGSVWDIDDTVYPWSAFDTAGVVNLDRASTSDANKVATPEGWTPGCDVIVPPPKTAEALARRAGEGFKTVDWYYSTRPL